MTAFSWVHHLDSRAWRTATWSAPFVVQFIVAAVLIAMWLLDKSSAVGHSQRTLLLSATGIATLLSLGVAAFWCRSNSLRRRALALSVMSSAAVVLLGGTYYAFDILR